jgi:two-component system, NarL family, sensor histidine kinase LiaS
MNNERVTLAQELHDGIAQDLVVLGFSIDQAIAQCQEADLKSSLRMMRFTTTTLIEKVRAEIHQLRTSEPLLNQHHEVEPMRELFLVIQEILRNVEKHSEAKNLKVEISDDGKGGVRSQDGSYGLQGIQERIAKLNGEIHIDSTPQGTRIGVTIPLEG